METASPGEKIRLGYNLALTQFKLKNESTYLGILWYLLEPLLLFLLIILVKDYIRGGNREGYPVYLLTGIVMFNFFRTATGGAAGVISGNASFVRNMRISSESLVLSRVLQAVLSHSFEFAVLCVFLAFFGFSLMNTLLYPLIFFFLAIFTLGVAFFLAAAGVYVSDIANAWNVVSRLLWFATPILYYSDPGTLIYTFNSMNPLFHFIRAARGLLMDGRLPGPEAVGIMAAVALASLVAGTTVFNRYKARFAELV